MRRRRQQVGGRPAAVVVALWLIVGPGVGPVGAQHVINVQQTRPAFTDAQAQQMVREILPLVERTARRRFRERPPLRVINRPEYVALYASSNAKGREQLENESQSIYGLYREKDKTLYLIPSNFNALFQGAEVSETEQHAVVKNVIAHELIHALQDQVVGLDKLKAPVQTLEQAMAIKALVEGQADFLADQVSRTLGLSPTLDQYFQRVNVVPDPNKKAFNRLIEFEKQRAYHAGSEFIGYFFRKGGIERVWQVFEAPPTDLGMIRYPDQYSPQPRPVRDYSVVFDGAEETLGGMQNKMVSLQVGPWFLEHFQREVRALNPYDKKTLEERVITCLHAIAKDRSRPDSWQITLYEFKDPESAQIVRELFKRNRPRWVKRTEAGPTLTFPPADSKSKLEVQEFSLELFASDEVPSRIWYASAVRGKYLMTFAGWYKGISNDALTSFFEQAWTRLPGRELQASAGQ